MDNEETLAGRVQEKPELQLTHQAVQQVKLLLARQKLEGYGLRVAVKDGGCSGYSYQLDFEKEQKPGDAVLKFEDLEVFMDSASSSYLTGTVIDYVSGLYGGGFRFVNPNATGSCGCGTSFSA